MTTPDRPQQLHDPLTPPPPPPAPAPPAPDPDVPPMPPEIWRRDETWQRMRAVLMRSWETASRASGHARQRGRDLGQRLAPRALDVAHTARAKFTAGGPGRWVRAVEGELVNLDGCDYVAVEQERGESYVVVARMHQGAANWVLARYGNRGDAARAQDWLAKHLHAWRLDLVSAAREAQGDSGVGHRAE